MVGQPTAKTAKEKAAAATKTTSKLLVIENRVLQTAMPIVAPSSCDDMAMPPACPCWCGGTAFMTARCGGTNKKGMAMPHSSKPGNIKA